MGCDQERAGEPLGACAELLEAVELPSSHRARWILHAVIPTQFQRRHAVLCRKLGTTQARAARYTHRVRPTWALPVLVSVTLGSGCFGSDAECDEDGGAFEPGITITTPSDLGELTAVEQVCMVSDADRPTLAAQLVFGSTEDGGADGTRHWMTLVAPLAANDACALVGTTRDLEATLLVSPSTAQHPPLMRVNGRMRVDAARNAPADRLSVRGELMLDGTGSPSVPDPDDMGFRYAAPPCE